MLCLEDLFKLYESFIWIFSNKTWVNFANFPPQPPPLPWYFSFQSMWILWEVQKSLLLQTRKQLLFTASRLSTTAISHTSSYLEERNRSAGSASEPAHLHPWNASSCAPSSQIGCRWHHRGQQSSIWASPGALECQLARYVSPVFQICLVAWLQLKVVKNDAHKMSSY